MGEATVIPGRTIPQLPGDYFQNPHEVHDALRAEGPAREVRMPGGLKVWFVTRYDEVKAALNAPGVSKNVGGRVTHDALAEHIVYMDPPHHTRLRRLVTKPFTARRVEKMRARIEEITAELLAELADGDVVDLLEAFAFPLPVNVICELLGIPIDNRDEFREWSNQVLTFGTPEQVRAATAGMAAFLHQHVAKVQAAEPDDTFFSALVHATDSGDLLSREELVSMAFLLLVAGHETTVNLIGNAVLALLRNPDQLRILRERPELIPASTDEFLRLEGSINIASFRYTTEPLELGEVTVPAGELLMVSLLAANRDPERFEDPGRLDVTRSAQGHVGFGHGIHYCLGAPLARLEFDVALTRLLERFPNLELAAEPETLVWRESTLIRGLHTLPVRLG